MRGVYNEIKRLKGFDDDKVHDDLVEVFIGYIIFAPVSYECFSEGSFYLDRPGDDITIEDDTIRRYSDILIIRSSKKSYAFDIFMYKEFFYDRLDYMPSFHYSRLVLILEWSNLFIDHSVH